MALADVVRKLIPVADSITASFQGTVQHRARTGPGSQGPAYAAAANRKGVVDYAPRLVRTRDNQEITPAAYVVFPRPEPVKPGDEVTLPNGVVGEVLDVPGVADPSTSNPFLTEIYVADRSAR